MFMDDSKKIKGSADLDAGGLSGWSSGIVLCALSLRGIDETLSA